MFNPAKYGNLPFPTDRVRDLLGLARTLYRHHRLLTEVESSSLQVLERAGLELATSLKGAPYEPRSMGFIAAWRRVERGTLLLSEYAKPCEGCIQALVRCAVESLREQVEAGEACSSAPQAIDLSSPARSSLR